MNGDSESSYRKIKSEFEILLMDKHCCKLSIGFSTPAEKPKEKRNSNFKTELKIFI